MGLARKFRKTIKKSFTPKGIISNIKNLSGVGLLQRSKTARKLALVSTVAVGGYFAAPYLATAGKAAFAAGKGVGGKLASKLGGKLTGSLAQKLYNPPINAMNATAAENTPSDNTDLVQQLYGPEVSDGIGVRRAVGVGVAGAAPAGCASVGGSVDEFGFLIATIALILVCAIPFIRRVARAYHHAASATR